MRGLREMGWGGVGGRVQRLYALRGAACGAGRHGTWVRCTCNVSRLREVRGGTSHYDKILTAPHYTVLRLSQTVQKVCGYGKHT